MYSNVYLFTVLCSALENRYSVVSFGTMLEFYILLYFIK